MQITITPENANTRLDAFVAHRMDALSRSQVQNLIRSGVILLNSNTSKPSAVLRNEDLVLIGEMPSTTHTPPAAENIALDLLYKDEHLLVVNKPAGLVVHPGSGNPNGTLVNALLHHTSSLSSLAGEDRPGIVHRLDKETSGCIVIATSDDAYRSLTAQFAARETSKQYLALVDGHPTPLSGTIEAAIERHPGHRQKMAIARPGKGKNAKTDYRVLHDFPTYSLVLCRLYTGRTHQIRVHLKSIGHPLVGDKIYNPKRASSCPRQMLHSWKLGLFHPESKKWMDFTAPLPDAFHKQGVLNEHLDG